MKAQLSRVVSICMQAWDNRQLNDLAPAVIADEYFTEPELRELESNEDLLPIWLFIQDFCDAAQHCFPDINECCSIQQGEAAMREIENYLSGRVSSLVRLPEH